MPLSSCPCSGGVCSIVCVCSYLVLVVVYCGGVDMCLEWCVFCSLLILVVVYRSELALVFQKWSGHCK